MAPILLRRLREMFVVGLEFRLDAVERRLRELSRQSHVRGQDPRSLLPYGHRCFSQNDEDGMIDEVFRRIGTGARFFVEFGVETGRENNTVSLLLGGWRGLWIEGDPASAQAVRTEFRSALEVGRLALFESFVTAENVEDLFRSAGVPEDFDLLSIDIDGNDFWVWKAIRAFRPRAVVIEYNASLGRTARIVRPYEPTRRWDGTSAFGASLAALETLGREKGYALVGCDANGVNAFFVRDDLVEDRFLGPFTAARHFEPPRFGPTGGGHPLKWAEFEEV